MERFPFFSVSVCLSLYVCETLHLPVVLLGFLYVNCFVSNEWNWKDGASRAELTLRSVRVLREGIVYSQEKHLMSY